MSRVVIVALCLAVVASAGYATGTASSAAPSGTYLAPTILATAGSITGIVRCGEEAIGTERPWSTVWVAGRSFSARTDEHGVFRIDYVPPGTYTLGVQTAGMPIREEFPGVTVLPRSITDVGFLDVTGGCGQCGGGGSGGCEGDEGGGCEGGEEGGGEEGGGGCEEGGSCG